MKNSFVFYGSWWEAIKNLPRDVQGDVLTAIVEYGLSGETTGQLKPIAKAMLAMAKTQIDVNFQRYKNGCLGGSKNGVSNNPTGKKAERNPTKKLPKTYQKATKDLPNENENENDIISSPTNVVEDITPHPLTKGEDTCSDLEEKSEPGKEPDLSVENPTGPHPQLRGTPSPGKGKALDLSIVEPAFQPVVADWLSYKSERGQTYRQRGLESLYRRLVELSGGNADTARRIVEQSKANNWAGLFEIKTFTNDERTETRTGRNHQPPSPDELARAVAEGISRAHTRQEWE